MSAFAAKENQGLDLHGKVAAISGGTQVSPSLFLVPRPQSGSRSTSPLQGIGAATGLRFAQAGASVFIIGRDEKRGAAVVEELKQAGGPGQTFEFIKADLR